MLSHSFRFFKVIWWCSAVKSNLTLWDPMDCSTPTPLSSTISHTLLKFMSIESVMLSNHLIPCYLPPLSFYLQSFPASGSFLMSQLFASGGQNIGASASASVLPMNTQDWFPLGLTGVTQCSSRDSQDSSPAPQFKNINSLALSLLYGPTLTYIHDYGKKHSFDYMDLCQQSDVSTF